MDIRELVSGDLDALQAAIDRDKFHPGEWKTEHFYMQPPEEGKYQPAVLANVIENGNGPIAFVRYTKTLRISCVWNNADETSRNAKAVIFGIRKAVELARASGFSEIIITTNYEPLAKFFVDVLGMTRSESEYLLQL